MNIILTLGPCSGETYDDLPNDQETLVVEYADVKDNAKVTKLDQVEYVRTVARINLRGVDRVVFRVKRYLPGKPV
jgi:hypothetical protein